MDGEQRIDAPDLGRPWRAADAIARIAHWLPTQRPLKEFIHHNPLHALDHHSFDEAVAIASRIFGARDYLPLRWYQTAYAEGRIRPSALRRVLRAEGVLEMQLDQAVRELAAERPEPPPPLGIAADGIRARWREVHGIDVDALVHPMLFRLLASYLDQGVSVWRMPHAGTATFWESVSRLVGAGFSPFPPLNAEGRALFQGDPDAALASCLDRLVGDVAYYERYLLETCLSHPGWSGMVHVLENNPSLVIARRAITLRDALAVELVLQRSWLERKLGRTFLPLARAVSPECVPPLDERPSEDEHATARRLWQSALEWTLYEEVFAALETHAASVLERDARTDASKRPKVQAFFCIDDRECSLRRHLEEIDPSVQTFGAAGFFGVDFLFQAATSAYAVQHCPVVLRPRHVVREVAHESTQSTLAPRLGQLFHFGPPTNTLFRGWLLTQLLGFWACLRLAWNVLRPGSRLLAGPELTEVDDATRLDLLRRNDERTPEGLFVGYSVEEMADRVLGVFRSAGLVSDFADIVVFVAHGSTSANNPHFAAYDCGACSGRPGSPNARSIAWMANHPEVRAALRARGFALPSSCFVVGALHDTTRDTIRYFDVEKLPESHRPLFDDFRKTMKEALGRNAQERCRRFELAPQAPSAEEALAHVRERALSIFEPRPELNHATNALAIVGRRSLTRGLFLDRRAFLNSYDPTTDPSGNVLASILAAVVPVCGGINLEYYFSRVDNEVYGAGTKLPHNVVSLVGVANGVDGDLRTGLPWQMVEIHEPIRLLVLVEQRPAVVLEAAKRNGSIFSWIRNGWVRLGAIDPEDGKAWIFESNDFVRVDPVDAHRAERARDSFDAFRGLSGNAPIRPVGKG
jgi:uncharacterized protein YbcC (UPF0753/DUF2309 family)